MADREKPGTVDKLKAIAHKRKMEQHNRQKQAALEAKANGRPPPKDPPISFSAAAIARSAFSQVMFELEDKVLDKIDESLCGQGWTVASLIYDGMLVEHRKGDGQDPSTGGWLELESALRVAEEAVAKALDYRISLLEKPLYGGPGDEDVNPRKRIRRTEPGDI